MTSTELPATMADRSRRGRAAAANRPRLDIARMTDNELVLFDYEHQESWIVYPPRSRYDFLRRPSADAVLVEHHPWAPFSPVVQHTVLVRDACTDHGVDCGASAAIQAGLDAGWNPFA